MTKNYLFDLILLLAFVMGGLLLANLLLLFIFWMNGSDFSEISNMNNLDTLSSTQLMIAQLSSHVIGLILPAFLLTKISKSINPYLSEHSFSSSNFVKCILLFVLVLPLVSYTAYLNQQILLPEWMQSNEEKLQEMINKLLHFNHWSDLILAVITIGIIPGIGEEWIFRGIIQTRTQLLLKNKWIAILITSILFSAIHMQFEGFLPRFLLGFILGYIFSLTKNIWYPILLHIGFNSTQVIASYYLGIEMLDEKMKLDKAPLHWMAAICLTLGTIGVIYYFEKKEKSTYA